ncbi:MAG: hypothetical protein ACYC21_11710 [Eubacteriales bacterium]
MILFNRLLFLRAIQWEANNNAPVTAKNISLYLDIVPTAAKPTPLNPSDANTSGPSQDIQAKNAATTEPKLAAFSFKQPPPLWEKTT